MKKLSKWSIALCVCVLSFGEAKAQFSLGSLGDLFNSETVNSVIGAITNSEDKFEIADLAGTWTYSAPACKFESGDLLKAAGGEVAAASLNKKLATYYKKAGITSSRVSMTFADTTFVMKYGKAKLNGNLMKDEESGRYVITFTALNGYVPVMVVDAVITKSGDKLEMLFDVGPFIQVLSTVASKSQNSTLNTITGLLDGYEGILMGFELRR